MDLKLVPGDNALINTVRAARQLLLARKAWLEKERTLYVERLTSRHKGLEPDLDLMNELEDERFQVQAEGLSYEAMAAELQVLVDGYEIVRERGANGYRVEIRVEPISDSNNFVDPPDKSTP